MAKGKFGMPATMEFIREELKKVREERRCGEHGGGRHYWRGYRDSLLEVRATILQELEKLNDFESGEKR